MLTLTRLGGLAALIVYFLSGLVRASMLDEFELPTLSADSQEFDSETNQLVASGNAELSHGSLLLQGDTIIFVQKENMIKVREGATLTRGSFRVLGDFADYNYFEKSFLSGDFRMGSYPIYMTGEKVSGDLERVVVENGRLYFQEPDPFAMNLDAERIELLDEETLQLENVTFKIGAVPVFWLPYYEQKVSHNGPLRWKAEVGYQKNLGVFWQNKLLVRLVEGFKLGANLDGYSNRGFLGGPAGDYNWVMGEDSWQRGSFETGFIDDIGSSGERGSDVLGRPVEASRNFIEWRHQGQFREAFTLNSTLSWWSDSEVTRDFHPELFVDNQVPDSFTEGVYRGEHYLASVFIRYQPNDWEVIAQRFPELSFALLPTELFETGVYQRLNTNFVHLEEKDPSGAIEELQSDRFNLFYSLTRPTVIAPWLTVTPVVGGMVTYYAQTLNDQGSYARTLGEIGIDVEAMAVGTWDYQNAFWKIDGLRHIFQPVLQYRYIPAAQAGDTLIPQIDRQAAFETYLEPLELGDRRSIDALYETNAIRLGFENRLQTRHAEGYGSRDLVELSFYEEFRFTTAPSQVVNVPGLAPNTVIPAQSRFSDLYTDLKVYPVYWLRLGLFNRFDSESLTNRQFSSHVRIQDAELWSLTFGNDYVQDLSDTPINQYHLEGNYRLNDRNLLRALWRMDAQLGELVEQYYAWRTRFGNAWDVEFQVGYLQGASRENDLRFRLRVDLLHF